MVTRLFNELGTATNLLGIIRRTPPAGSCSASEVPPGPGLAEADPVHVYRPGTIAVEEHLPGVIYGEHNRPAFDPTSKQRYDLHPSNPDAAAFFTDQELAVRPEPSSTARAIGR